MFRRRLSISVYVIKADGSRQLFDREKVIKTCLRMGSNRYIAEEIVDKIEAKIYDGISTETILQMVFRLLRRYNPTVRHLLDLRKGLSLMNSKPEFERFVQILLRETGYEVSPNKILKGKCGEHEVDAIARKDNVTYFVEVKHHFNFRTPTGLDESRIARAVLEDITEGFELGLNDLKIDRAMIITNTKFSGHAKRYGECRRILQIGWSSPPYHGLQDLIEEHKLHPLTCLKDLKKRDKDKLASAEIVLMKDLIEEDPEKLRKKTGISKQNLTQLIEKAKTCTYTLYH